MEGFLSKKETSKITGMSITSIWRACNSSTFPKPRQLSKGRVAFLAAEVEGWRDQDAPLQLRERNRCRSRV